MIGILPCEMFDRDLCRFDDRLRCLAARLCVPSQIERSLTRASIDGDVRDFAQSEPRCLNDCRDSGTHDVFSVLRPAGMA